MYPTANVLLGVGLLAFGKGVASSRTLESRRTWVVAVAGLFADWMGGPRREPRDGCLLARAISPLVGTPSRRAGSDCVWSGRATPPSHVVLIGVP